MGDSWSNWVKKIWFCIQLSLCDLSQNWKLKGSKVTQIDCNPIIILE